MFFSIWHSKKNEETIKFLGILKKYVCKNKINFYLKLMSAISDEIFIFSPNDSSSKALIKCFFMIKLFSFSRYSNFCKVSLPFRTNESGIIYDVTNWLA